MPARPQSLADWLDYIQRQHARSIDLDLQRADAVWRKLGGMRPDCVISIAGTNGKGSCVALLEALYARAGHRVGAYTSPHLRSYTERFRIDGTPVDEAAVSEALAAVEAARGDIPLTYFEFSTLCALVLFERAGVRAGLFEVGMGGRLDAVNILPNQMALITSIGLDHQAWLGEDLPSIAREKAGIIKPGGRVVLADAGAPEVIDRIAAERGATLLRAGRDYAFTRQTGRAGRGATLDWHSEHAVIAPEWRRHQGLSLALPGAAQGANLAGVMAVAGWLQPELPIDPADCAAALRQVTLDGRCQIIGREPLVVVDVAHNPAAVAELHDFLAGEPVAGETAAVVGMLDDKPAAELLGLMADQVDRWYFAGITGDMRGQSGAALRARCADFPGQAYADAPAAYAAARRETGFRGRIVIFGSFHIVGAILDGYAVDN